MPRSLTIAAFANLQPEPARHPPREPGRPPNAPVRQLGDKECAYLPAGARSLAIKFSISAIQTGFLR